MEIKSCPFCGATPLIRYWCGGGDDKRWYKIYCGNDDCRVTVETDSANSVEGAIKIWNERILDAIIQYVKQMAPVCHTGFASDYGYEHGWTDALEQLEYSLDIGENQNAKTEKD